MAESKTSARKVLAAERRVMALELRKAGLSYQKIAAQLGVSAPAVFKMVTNALRELNQEAAETAEEVRRLELERLDEWQIRVSQELKGGNVLPAIDRGLRIMDRRASLLGLDAPKRKEVGVSIPVDLHERLVQAAREEKRRRAAAAPEGRDGAEVSDGAEGSD